MLHIKSDESTVKIHIRFNIPFTVFQSTNRMLDVVPFLLTSGLNSRLYILRREYGLVYYISSKIDTDYFNSNLSSYIIETEVNPKHIEKVLNIIRKELNVFKNTLISDSELKRVKNIFKLKKKQYMMKNDIEESISMYKEYALFGVKIKTFSEYYRKRNRITKNYIKNIAGKMFNEKNMFIAYSGKNKI
jgi:predicted Zn-dependent peptidase